MRGGMPGAVPASTRAGRLCRLTTHLHLGGGPGRRAHHTGGQAAKRDTGGGGGCHVGLAMCRTIRLRAGNRCDMADMAPSIFRVWIRACPQVGRYVQQGETSTPHLPISITATHIRAARRRVWSVRTAPTAPSSSSDTVQNAVILSQLGNCIVPGGGGGFEEAR